MANPPPRALARLTLRRVAVAAAASPRVVEEPWPPDQTPYSRTLWGAFLPDRRGQRAAPPGGLERRRG